MNEGIINLFGATNISSGVESLKGAAVPNNPGEMNHAESENIDPVDSVPDAAAYHELVTEEFEQNDTRIAMIGNVDSGKSTLIGVMTNATLDDGRGAARAMVLKHRHEQENGRTSAVTVEIMGYKGKFMEHFWGIECCWAGFFSVCGRSVHILYTLLVTDLFPLSCTRNARRFRRAGVRHLSQPRAPLGRGDGEI